MSVTVKELDSLIEDCFLLRDEHAQAKRKAAEIHEELERKQNIVIGHLTELEKTSYKAPSGTFSFSVVENYKVPKDPESRKVFFHYLRERGVYEDLITVNSRTLNSWAKQEAEASDSIDHQIPGIEKSEPIMKASMRK